MQELKILHGSGTISTIIQFCQVISSYPPPDQVFFVDPVTRSGTFLIDPLTNSGSECLAICGGAFNYSVTSPGWSGCSPVQIKDVILDDTGEHKLEIF